MTERRSIDGVLVVGAGLAGLSAALAAAPRAALVIAAAPTSGCATHWAQGGMAAALSPDDSPTRHAADTIAAGAGLCEPHAVAILTEAAPAVIARLAQLGAPFDRDAAGHLIQGLEAAHSRARIAKVGGDGAGAAILAAVGRAARAAATVEFAYGLEALGLIVDGAGAVRGVTAREANGAVIEIIAPATVLATGGAGGLWALTTNPPQALGAGVAMAARAGTRIRDPEFVQFHPTAMALGLDPAPLATEALRGDGAVLIDREGRRIMADAHPLGDLAPRDVVARAVAASVAGGRGAFLDGRIHPGEAFPRLFPTVFAACAGAGLDPRRSPIPIAPAAHYMMGGIETDLFGRTSLPGLLAAGECAATGVHGANRLASNSLLEACVFGARAGAIAAETPSRPMGRLQALPLAKLPAAPLAELRERMSAGAGVVRDRTGLAALLSWIEAARSRYGQAGPLLVAALVVEAALARRESRGAHFRTDYPQPATVAAPTRIERAAAPASAAA